MGSAGGKATLKKYGIGHFKELGRRGFDAVVNRYFAGDRQSAIDWLHRQQAERQLDLLASQKLESGEETCIELPVILSPDDDPYFREPQPSWRERVRAGKEEERTLPF